MAIADIAAYAHLSQADIEALGYELDAIRSDIEESLGERTPPISGAPSGSNGCSTSARGCSSAAAGHGPAGSWGPRRWPIAKSVENMEIGHNVLHGQWDWMNDPEIHSSTWEWDMVGVSSQWRYSHNYRHHVFSNVLGVDDDLGFGVMRVTRDQAVEAAISAAAASELVVGQPSFEWGIALHGVDFGAGSAGAGLPPKGGSQARALIGKIARQAVKDYVLFPALSRSRWRRTLAANATANLLRNLWAYVVIFCGHFPDGAEKFTADVLEDETRAEWYLRQMLGAANFKAGPLLAFSSGNLCYQIEHHLFPDLPSNRYAQIAVRVRALCDKYDLPYTSGSLVHQYLSTLRTIHRLALPDRFLAAR